MTMRCQLYIKAISIVAFSICVLSFTSCKKDKLEDSSVESGPGPYVAPQISIDKVTGYPGEVLTINYWDIPDLDSYQGQFNGEAIKVLKTGAALSFLVPNVAKGSYPFKVKVDGKVIEYNLQVLEAPVLVDADQLIKEYEDKTELALNSLEGYLNSVYGSSANYPAGIQQDIATWAQIESQAQQAMSQMSEAEKEKLARILLANQAWIDDLSTPLINERYGFKTADDCKKIITEGKQARDDGDVFKALGLGISAYWCGVKLHIDKKTDNALSKAAILWDATENQFMQITVVNLAGRQIDQLSKEFDELGNSAYIADDIEEIDRKSSATPFEFCNGDRQRVFANIRFRSISPDDTKLNTPYAPFANMYAHFISAYEDYATTISQALVWRPEYLNASQVVKFNRFLSVPKKSITNSKALLINTQIVDDFWEVIFATDEPNEQKFNFKIVYDDGYVNLQRTFSGTVKECSMIGRDGPGGGMIVYDQGDYYNGWRYIEITKQPIGTAEWGCIGTNINTGASYDYGSGFEKTQKIINSCSEAGIAARMCDNYSQNGFSDWFLPAVPSLYIARLYGLGGYDVPYIPLPPLPTYVWSSSSDLGPWNNDPNYPPEDYNSGAAIDSVTTGLYAAGAILRKDKVYSVYAARRF